jgi:hypothetical protein
VSSTLILDNLHNKPPAVPVSTHRNTNLRGQAHHCGVAHVIGAGVSTSSGPG